MRFSRTVSLIKEMRIFECKPCRLVITAEHLQQFPELADAFHSRRHIEITSKIERHRSVHEPAALTPSYSGVISAFRASTVKPIRFKNSWFFMGTGAPVRKGV